MRACRRVVIASVALVLFACGDGGDGDTNPSPVTLTISVTKGAMVEIVVRNPALGAGALDADRRAALAAVVATAPGTLEVRDEDGAVVALKLPPAAAT